MRATEQDGSYPRPQLVREHWRSLDGAWDFAFDDDDAGLAARWYEGGAEAFDRRIVVPFPPESPASQVGETGFHPVVWYRRGLDDASLAHAAGERVLVHFGAVDFRAQVWFDGALVATHVGGQTPFTADITDALDRSASEHVLVVRAHDDPADLEMPRGKQDWRERPHSIWYERTTGIWQPVWLEVVAADHVVGLAWTADPALATVTGELALSRRPARPLGVRVTVRLGDELLAEQTVLVAADSTTITLTVDALRNGQERGRLMWTPGRPTLLDAEVRLTDRSSGVVLDTVASYLGVRTAGVSGGVFRLNGQPFYLRAVLDQGYRPQTHLASAGTEELRAEVVKTKRMGFNTVRVHQKAEDPRFLFWADKLGLLVWGETAGAYTFSQRAVTLLTEEWMQLVRRDRSHPSIVAWVPINESWGVQDIAQSPAQQNFARSIAALTRALDPTRPVLSNEGWEHVDSDILGIHDYTTDPEVLRARYASAASADALVRAGQGPAGRRPVLDERQLARYAAGTAPLMVTEFGGISMSTEQQAWGYATAGSDSEYATLVRDLFAAVRDSPHVAGFCYTQFMDTGQETNGLLSADGTPKLPWPVIRHIVTGIKDRAAEEAASAFGWQA